MSADMNWDSVSKEVRAKIQAKASGENLLRPLVLLCGLSQNDLGQMGAHLNAWGVEFAQVSEPSQAISVSQKNYSKLLLVISASSFGGVSASEFCKELQKSSILVPIIIFTSNYDLDLKNQVSQLQGVGLLEEKFDPEHFAAQVAPGVLKRLDLILEEFELLRGFIDETKGLIEQIEGLALELERNPTSKDILNSLFGIIHTLKGASAFFEPKTMHHFFHRFEDVLKKVQANTLPVSAQLISATLKVVDTARRLLREFDTQQHQNYQLEDLCKIFSESVLAQGAQDLGSLSSSENSSESNPSSVVPIKENSIKIDIQLLDQFLRASGEMTVVRNMVNKTVATLEKRYSADKDVFQLSELLEELHKVNASLQSKITEVRKVSLKSVYKTLPRLVRDVTSRTKKSCSLHLEGEDLRVDSSISEVLNTSLSHLIRNSIDHGLELPSERAQVRKPEKGQVYVRAALKNEQVIVEVRDDGKGIDTETIRKKIVTKGLRTEGEVAQLSDAEVNAFIFESGFSTAAQTTEISGRGVGMSAVKDSVESIGGRIRIETEKSKGTAFYLELPIPKSVHIKNCLFVVSGGEEFGVAQDQIVRLINIDEDVKRNLIFELQGGSVIRSRDGSVIPLVSLHQILFPLSQPRDLKEITIVIVRTEGGKDFGLIVEGIRDFEDAVVKEIAPSLKRLGAYSGATFLSDGTVGLLLSVDGIGKLAAVKTEKVRATEVELTAVETSAAQNLKEWLLFELGTPGIFAIPRETVFRIEEFESKKIQKSGCLDVIPYRERVLPILSLTELLSGSVVQDANLSDRTSVVVLNQDQKLIGLSVKQIIDIAVSEDKLEPAISGQKGIQGNIILGGKTITVIDPVVLVAA